MEVGVGVQPPTRQSCTALQSILHSVSGLQEFAKFGVGKVVDALSAFGFHAHQTQILQPTQVVADVAGFSANSERQIVDVARTLGKMAQNRSSGRFQDPVQRGVRHEGNTGGGVEEPAGFCPHMADEPFHDPHVGIGKVYTRTGDGGDTSLVGGQRLSKADARIEAYGDVDELNAVMGMVAVAPECKILPKWFDDRVVHIQHDLFNAGSRLATLETDMHPQQPRIRLEDVTRLETWLDEANEGLPGLTSFVLPGGSRVNALLHLARTVCRRCERRVVALGDGEDFQAERHYLNRLSDLLFVWSRWVQKELGKSEVLWNPNAQ